MIGTVDAAVEQMREQRRVYVGILCALIVDLVEEGRSDIAERLRQRICALEDPKQVGARVRKGFQNRRRRRSAVAA